MTTAKKINTTAYGSEPKWDDDISAEDAPFLVVKSLYWYRIYATPKQLKQWTLDHVKEHIGTKAVKDYKNGNKKEYEEIGATCRIVANGCPLEILEEKINAGLAEIKGDTLSARKRSSDAVKNLTKKPKVDPKEKFNHQLGEYLHRINIEIDRLVDYPKIKKKDWFDPESFFKSKSIKPEFAVEIVNSINPTLNELKEALEGEDEQLTEAYNFLKKRYHTRLIEFITDIVEVAKKYSNKRILTKSGKKKKKKPTTPAMVVKKLPCMDKFSELSLISIDPKEIVGASVLYVYNTVSRLIHVYISNDTKGLSAKGASITGYNEKKSFVKKLRNPKHSTFMISSGKTKKYTLEHVKNIKTKEKPVRPRLNKSCIILKVF